MLLALRSFPKNYLAFSRFLETRPVLLLSLPNLRNLQVGSFFTVLFNFQAPVNSLSLVRCSVQLN